MVDFEFEKASINAFQTVFNGVTIKGCFFHFGLSNWRKIQETGLAPVYREDKQTLKLIVALVLKPELDFEIGVAALCFEVLVNCDDDSPLMDFVE